MDVLKKYTHAWEIKVLVCTMVYAFFLILSESNAGYSISLSLLLIYTVWNYKYGRYGTDSKFPGPILIAYGSFFTCLFIAAVFQPDRTTMQLTLKYLSWAFPFIPMFYGYVKEKSEAGLFLGAGLAVFMLANHPDFNKKSFVAKQGSHLSILPTIIEAVAPRGFIYYALEKSLLEISDEPIITPNQWMTSEYIGDVRQQYGEPVLPSVTAVKPVNRTHEQQVYEQRAKNKASFTTRLIKNEEKLFL